jgi:uncharacterized membrane protein YeaQ/YmgE (transglycosylase-associated protein family)
MWVLWALLVGLVVGAVARLLMPGRDPMGFVMTALLGVAGALMASWIGRQLGWYGDGDGAGFIAAVLGSMLLLFLYRLFARRGG